LARLGSALELDHRLVNHRLLNDGDDVKSFVNHRLLNDGDDDGVKFFVVALRNADDDDGLKSFVDAAMTFDDV